MRVHFVHSEGGDWVGLYVDGELVFSDHSLTPEKVLTILGIPYTEEDISDEDMENGLPEFLDNL